MFLAFFNASASICYYETLKSFFGKFEWFSHAVSKVDEKGISQFSLTLIIAL